jgi:hypothetical protein
VQDRVTPAPTQRGGFSAAKPAATLVLLRDRLVRAYRRYADELAATTSDDWQHPERVRRKLEAAAGDCWRAEYEWTRLAMDEYAARRDAIQTELLERGAA